MASREIWSLAGTFSTWVKGFVILLILSVCASSLQAREYEAEQQRLDKFFPGASLSSAEGDYQVRTITKGDEVLGYAFQSINVVDIPAYSGKTHQHAGAARSAGCDRRCLCAEHHEPILLIGIPEQKLHDFNAKYQGIRADQRVVVGRSSDSNAVTIDAVTGATVTVMVVNEIVMRAAHEVAVSLGLIEGAATRGRRSPACARTSTSRPTGPS